MSAEIITPEMRATCLEARDTLIELEAANMLLRSKLDEARSKNLKMEFCLSAILLLDERQRTAPGAISEFLADFRSCCATIRVALGLAPLKGTKPVLAVDNVGRGA